jgi:hypothetical protein
VLVTSTARVAALVAAGQMAAASGPAVVLMKGVMRAMLMKKLRLAAGTVVVLAALGMVGFAHQAAGLMGAAQAAPPEKPVNELEALRKENELLKLNLQIVLEKVRTQEGELQTARKDLAARDANISGLQLSTIVNRNPLAPDLRFSTLQPFNMNTSGLWLQPYLGPNTMIYQGLSAAPTLTLPSPKDPVSDATKEAESAVKALREAKDKEGRQRAAEALEKAMKKLKEGLK